MKKATIDQLEKLCWHYEDKFHEATENHDFMVSQHYKRKTVNIRNLIEKRLKEIRKCRDH